MSRNRVELVGTFRDQMSGKMARVGKAMKKFGGMARTGAMGVGILGAALLAAAKKLSDFGASIQDTADATGVAVQQVQAISYGLEQAGGSADSFGKALKTQAKFVVAVGDGMAIQTDMLENLGMTYEDLEDLEPDEIFLKLSKALTGVEDATVRADTAMVMFGGRGAATVLTALEQFDGDIQNAIDAFSDLGYALSDEQVANLKSYADAMTDMSFRMRSFLADAIVPMLPALEGMADKFMELAEDRLPQLLDAAQAVIPVLTAIIDIASTAGEGWAKLTGADAKAGVEEMAEALGNYATVLETAVAQGNMTAQQALAEFNKVMEDSLDSYEGSIEDMSRLRGGLEELAVGVNLATAAWTEFQNRFRVTDDIIATGEALAGVGQGIFDTLMQQEGVINLLDAVTSWTPPEITVGTGVEEISPKVIAALQAEKDAYADTIDAEIEEMARRDEAVLASEDARSEAHAREKEERREMAELEEELHQSRLERAEEYLNAAKGVISQLLSTYSSFYSLRTQQISQERKQAIENIQNSTKDEETKKAMIENINQKYDEKEKAAKEKMKPIKVAEAISNVALGVTQALASAPPPWNFIQAGLVSAAGIAQIATIQGQKYAEGGLVRGYGSGDTVAALLTPGEWVLTKDQTRAMLDMSKSSASSAPIIHETHISIDYNPNFSSASPAEMALFTEAVVKAGKKAGKW